MTVFSQSYRRTGDRGKLWHKQWELSGIHTSKGCGSRRCGTVYVLYVFRQECRYWYSHETHGGAGKRHAHERWIPQKSPKKDRKLADGYGVASTCNGRHWTAVVMGLRNAGLSNTLGTWKILISSLVFLCFPAQTLTTKDTKGLAKHNFINC